MIHDMMNHPMFWILLGLLVAGVAFFCYCIVASGSRYENDMRIEMRYGQKPKPTQLEKYNADKRQK